MGHSENRSDIILPPTVPLFASSWMALFCLIRSSVLGRQRMPARQHIRIETDGRHAARH